jgi:glycosyltransferase involved in cell wall biosynthesis
MTFSVVIPARNAAEHLDRLLSALLPQLLPGEECFVVNDASTDRTARIAEGYDITVLTLETRGGPAAARNFGARHATSDILLFLDADVVPHANLVDRMRRQLLDAPDLTALIGSYDAHPAAPSVVSRFRNLLHCYTHHHADREASTFWAGCGAIRRTAFESVGGFDAKRFPVPSIEDIELGVRLKRSGGRIRLDAALQVQHRKAWTLRGMLYTDLVHRAIPWTALILESRKMPLDLNLKLSQRVSGAAVAAALLLLLWTPWAALPFLTIALACNAHFYRFLAAHGGWWFALRCIPLHWSYFLCSDLGFAIACARFFLRRSWDNTKSGH